MRLRPYSFFFLMTLALVVLGYFEIQQADQVHSALNSTYYADAMKRFYGGLAFLMFGLWCIYALTDRYIFPLHRGMTWIHILLSVAGVSIYLYRDYTGFSLTTGNKMEQQLMWMQGAVLGFLVGQLMFPINIFRSVILRARNRHQQEE